MSFAQCLGEVRRAPGDIDALDNLARAAIAEGEESAALPFLHAAANTSDSALIWQWVALLDRAVDAHELALEAFGRAAKLAPGNAGIAHGHARVALEAGIDAQALFDTARRLAPANSDILLGQAAARVAAGEAERAVREIEALLADVPMWIEGHRQFAQLSALLGRRETAAATLRRALNAHPHAEVLWQELFALHLQAEEYAALAKETERASATGQLSQAITKYRAIALSESGDPDAAERHFAALGDTAPDALIWRIRHLLRADRAVDAQALIDRALATDSAAAVWPYATIAWRKTGDPRSDWLERLDTMVRSFDLDLADNSFDDLAAHLRSLHTARGEYLDQSVRGGTQTDGPLFSRIDPRIRAVRAAVIDAVEQYRAQLPPADSHHPLLAPRRDRRIRFAGSWSVRLRGGGYHANHVHPQGWISSALYVSLPPRREGDPTDAGYLTLGEPQRNVVDLLPRRVVEPMVGRLVLFPSWMWHGTRPFGEGERLTIAFDVAPPR